MGERYQQCGKGDRSGAFNAEQAYGHQKLVQLKFEQQLKWPFQLIVFCQFQQRFQSKSIRRKR